MEVERLEIPEVLLLRPQRFADDRGYFVESFNAQRFAAAAGLAISFVQDNQSLSHAVGTVRGLHFQRPPAAQAKLGDLFDVSEYPNAEDLRQKFSFKFNYVPLPDAGDWRLDIGNEALASLQEQYQAHYTGQLDTAMRDIWQRLYKTLSTLSAQLSDKTEDGKTPRIFASVFDRMQEVLDLMETCNMTGDPQMQLMQRRLSQTFKGVTIEDIKDDAYLRRETKQAIDAAIKNLPSLDL
jgi:hypothetical protein